MNSVSGTGKIISQNSNDASVPADFGLVVESVDVAVGDVVGEGQVLCKLQGQTYLGGTAVMVEDTDHFYVEATVSEYDIPDVQKGMKAVVKTDATRDDELTGTVTFVSPKADASQNSLFDMNSMLSNSSFSSLSSLTSTSSSDNATFSITITLDDENDRLRLGMNASVSIVTDQSENTLSVPYEAVYTDENGSNYVFLQKTKKDENGKKLNYSEKVPDLSMK